MFIFLISIYHKWIWIEIFVFFNFSSVIPIRCPWADTGPKHSTQRALDVWGEKSHPGRNATMSWSPRQVWAPCTGVMHWGTDWTLLLGGGGEQVFNLYRNSIQRHQQERKALRPPPQTQWQVLESALCWWPIHGLAQYDEHCHTCPLQQTGTVSGLVSWHSVLLQCLL